MRCSGVVLAGGSSTRMGRDKALIRVDGERLVDRAVRHLHEVAVDVVVASGARRIEGLAVPQIPDQQPGSGPLGGLSAALFHAEHALAHVLAVDLPYAEPALFRSLAERWEGEAAIIPTGAGQAQPLHAVWATSAAIGLTVLIDRGVRSVLQAAEMLDATVLDAETTGALVDHDRWATNVNRPEDLPSDRE